MRLWLVIVLASAAGCATTAGPPASLAASAQDDLAFRLPPPDTTGEAQSYLTGALAAMRAGQPQHAALFLDAILRSDHLTDRGRANIYWLAAEAHRLAGEPEMQLDALGGFLVAAEVDPPDDDVLRREVDARATLTARKVKAHPFLGKSPDDAIPVEDSREPSGIVAELGCGRNGDSPYLEDAVSTFGAATERRLEQRRLICSDTGEPLVLWFDVTHTR